MERSVKAEDKCQCQKHEVPVGSLQFHFDACEGFPQAEALELDYEYRADHSGPPVISKDYAIQHHIFTRFCPVAAKISPNDFTPEGTWLEVRYKNDHAQEFGGWADIVKRRSPWYDENGWRRKNGSVPDLILGPEFLTVKRSEHDDFVVNTIEWGPANECPKSTKSKILN